METAVLKRSNIAKWRLSKSPNTVIFRFQEHVYSPEQGLSYLREEFGEQNIVAVRDLCEIEELKKDRAALEVLFATANVRKRALREGVKIGKASIKPIPTILRSFKFTVIDIHQLPLEPPGKTYWKVIASLLNHQSFKYEKTPVIEDVVFEQSTRLGAYDGHVVVILQGIHDTYHSTVAKTVFLEEYQAELPTSSKFAHTYCGNCKTIDDHSSHDCSIISSSQWLD